MDLAVISDHPVPMEALGALPLPPGGEHTMAYMLVSHRLTEGSAVHQWFWTQILDTLATLRSDSD